MRFSFNPFTDKLDISGLGPGATSVDFITGNSGGIVMADAGYNIFILGDNTTGIDTIGNLAPNTLTIVGLPSSTTQVGTTRYATNAEAAAQTETSAALTPSNITSMFSTNPVPSSQGGTGLSSPAAHSLIVTNGTSAYTPLGVASNGQIPIGSIGGNPVLANITSTGGTVTITNGPGTINLESSATGDVQTLTGNTGGAVSPTGGTINTVGTGSITIAGSTNTLTTQLTGLTNHSVLVGAGTATITKVAPSATSGVPLISQGAAADPVFGTAVVAGGGTGAVTLTGILTGNGTGAVTANTVTQHGILVGGASNAASSLGVATNGQIAIGSVGADPVLATLTQGAGISITNGAGSITIASTSSGVPWTNVTGTSQAIAVNNGYLSNNAGTVAFTLPASATIGDVFRIAGVQGAWTLAQAANQQIKFGSSATTVGITGSLASTDAGDSIECIATNTSASTVWRVISSIGNITVA